MDRAGGRHWWGDRVVLCIIVCSRCWSGLVLRVPGERERSAGPARTNEDVARGAAENWQLLVFTRTFQGRAAVEEHLTKDDWHFWVSMKTGQVGDG